LPSSSPLRRRQAFPALRAGIAGVTLLSLLVVGCSSSSQPPPWEGDRPREITNSIGMKLVGIPAGVFTMGSPLGEKTRFDDEEQHEVEISRPFYLGAYEVTQEEWQRVMGEGNNPSNFNAARLQRDTSRFPVETVSWQEADEFCRKLSQMPEEKSAGRVYRLPTEAEWEYAARNGTADARRSTLTGG
jgi:formylglycine-generating enzyme required for sulfatase activity